MPSNHIDDTASKWLGRVTKSNDYYKTWSDTFDVDTLEEYFYGFQWKDGTLEKAGRRRYVINLIFSTIEIKKSTLLFQDVCFHVKPKPKTVDFDYEAAVQRCQLLEDTLNTVISDRENDFEAEFEMYLCDAFFRFGIIETGYSANWIENPKAGKPILRSDTEPYVDPDDPKNVLKEPEELPENERVYVKRIPAWRFRVGGIDGHNFRRTSWVGYYDFFRIEDIKANKELENLDKIEWSGNRSEDSSSGMTADTEFEESQIAKTGDYCKVWTIYDLRKKEKLLILENHSVTLLKKKFKDFPLTALKFVNKLRGWYPIPLVFNWKPPQDEINEAREQQRTHRRRGNRKFLYRDGAFADDNEIAKLEDGNDMSFSKTQQDPSTCIAPLQQTPADPGVAESMLVAKDDFNSISATASEERGQADRTTATQANIISQRAQIRETRARTQVASSLEDIGYNVLRTIQTKFTLPLWIKMNTVPTDENFMEQEQETIQKWKQITSAELGEDFMDFEVNLSLDSISPIENEDQKRSYVDFLTLLTQFPQNAFSPTMVRETAYRCGYRNEKIIREAMKMAQIAAIGQQAQAQQSLAMATGGGPQGAGVNPQNNLADARTKQMQTPNLGGIQAQLEGQLPQ